MPLRVGIHVEHEMALALVVALSEDAGHVLLPDQIEEHSLSNYLETTLAQLSDPSSHPYDLLVLEQTDDSWLTDVDTLARLVKLLSIRSVPILMLTDAANELLCVITNRFDHIAFLPRRLLALQTLLQTIDQLLHRAIQRPDPLVEQERQWCVERMQWLNQRQEWWEGWRAWVYQRLAWLQERRKQASPQKEWLAEQEQKLGIERQEAERQLQTVDALRRWLTTYQSHL